MLSDEIAIVGIDSQFAEFANIDGVARALYLGKSSSKVASCCADNSPNRSAICSTIMALTARMFDALSCHSTTPLDVMVVFQAGNENQKSESSDEQLSVLTANLSAQSHINSAVVVSQLSEALTTSVSLTDKGHLVALVGVNSAPVHSTAQCSAAENNDTISFDQHFTGYQTASGIAGLLLASKALALQTQLPIYAWLNSLATSAVNIDAMKAAVTKSLNSAQQGQVTAQVEPQVALVEVSALEGDFHSALESSVLLEAYGESYANKPLSCAISCARSITGEGAGFSQVLGLLRTVIALQQRYIPGINHWQTPKTAPCSDIFYANAVASTVTSSDDESWQSSNFYFPTESRSRYPNVDGSKHSAAYSCLTKDSYCHMVLTEPKQDNNEDIRLNGFLASSELRLILVKGEDEAQLQQQLVQLASSAQLAQLTSSEDNNPGHDDLKMMADQQYQQYLTTSAKKYTLVLLADTIKALITEIELAQQGIKSAFANVLQASSWQTPKGSYFSATPAAYVAQQSDLSPSADKANNVCFMYPGIGATYLGLGRDLFQLFPEIYPEVTSLADDIASSLKDTLLNPRSISRLDFNALKQRDLALRGSLADIGEAGVAFACVFSKIFTKVFKLNADFATGYSMGEVSMYAALGCWQQPGVMSARLANSTTFNERLSGELLTLREHWALPLPNSNINSDSNKSTHTENSAAPLWETYAIKATLAEVETACLGETRVYCTIINTPDSVLLAGYPADCLRVIKKLAVRAMPLNMANAIHSAPAKAEYDNMVALYTMAVNARLNTKLYSSSCYLPIPQLSKAIAHSIAKCLCDRVDFPRLINTLYHDGARVFIEMGPGRSLSGWVDKILTGRQGHQLENKLSVKSKGINKSSLAVSINAKGVSDELSYFRAIAKLVSHGVKLDLNSVFYGSIIINKKLSATKHNNQNV